MCGFICIVKKPGQCSIPIPKSLLDHRGPDSTEEIHSDSFSVRHWRLSIVDLSSYANQPIQDDKFIFAYNGEIYNYSEISKKYFSQSHSSDSHLFFDLLKSGNFKKLQNASGFFSFILYDKKNLTLTGGRDFLGKKPLFYYLDKETLIIASAETSIYKLLNKKNNLNNRAILSYLYFKNLHFGDSYFEDIVEIPPGSHFEFDLKKWEFKSSFEWSTYYEIPLKERINSNLLDS